MTSEQTGTGKDPDRGERHRGEQWAATVASLAVGSAFLALWFWLLPIWLGFRVDLEGAARWRWIAAVPSALGFAVALRCIWDFGWTGTRNAGAGDSADTAGGGGILSLCAESDVPGIFRRLGGAVGDLWTWNCEPGRGRRGVRGRSRRSFVCPAVRGAAPAKDIRPGV
jgi:hypothetical protein